MTVRMISFFFQAEDGIRDLVRSRGLGDVYKRQARSRPAPIESTAMSPTMNQEDFRDAWKRHFGS